MIKKTYEEVVKDLNNLEKIKKSLKTKEVDTYNKKLIKQKTDVSDLKNHVLENQMVYRTYFQVSLGNLNDYVLQFEFIENNEDLLSDWWHVDELLQFIKKPVDFDFAFKKAQIYVNSSKTFTRRWGYVLFLMGLQKDKNKTKQILNLIKNDAEYYVQMGEAWLICDLCVFNPRVVVDFLKNSKLKYNILGKAIQKICDSYRINDEIKIKLKNLRKKLKEN